MSATRPRRSGAVRVYACGARPPSRATLRLKRGRSVSRLVFLKTRSKSRICVRVTSGVRILVDLQGRETQPEPRVKKPVAGACESGSLRQRMEPVSYTHLTLPTICSV